MIVKTLKIRSIFGLTTVNNLRWTFSDKSVVSRCRLMIFCSCSSASSVSRPTNMGKSKITTQLIAGSAATMSVMSVGFHLGWSSTSLPKLLAKDSDIPISPDESSWIASFFTFGGAIGPFVGAALVDRYGRKWPLLIAVIPHLISCIVIGAARGYWWFIVARFMGGMAAGVTYLIVPMYLGEIADDRIRGGLGGLLTFMLYLGALVTYCIGPWVSRVALAGVGGALGLVFGMTFIWMPESPYFLVMKEKLDDAEKCLLWFRGKEHASHEHKRVQENVYFNKKNSGTVKELVMVPGNRKARIIVLGLELAQQLSGIVAILSYSSLIFEASGSTLNSSVSVIIVGVVQLLSGVLTIFTVDLIGRRPLLMFSACGSILFLGAEALYFQLQAIEINVSTISWLPVTAMIGYIVCYGSGLGSMPNILLSELFPSNVKALATMATSVVNALCGFAVTKLYQVVTDASGIHVSFWGFTLITVFSVAFIHFMMIETKQRSFQSIQNELHKTTSPLEI